MAVLTKDFDFKNRKHRIAIFLRNVFPLVEIQHKTKSFVGMIEDTNEQHLPVPESEKWKSKTVTKMADIFAY